MQTKKAAERLGITQRMLRHYEKAGLIVVSRTLNGYRHYSEADLRRARRIQAFIATGFSTREIRAMASCLSDEGSGPCEAGIEKLKEKLAQIDRLRADLEERQNTIQRRLAFLELELASKSRAKYSDELNLSKDDD